MSPLRQSSGGGLATRRSRTPAVDQACAEAVLQARAAAEETAWPRKVGEHQGFEPEGDRVLTHYFACEDEAYRGWRWSVTVTRASRAKNVTVSECVLLPGEAAIMPPPWVPWLERLRPGDLGPGDLLPTPADDIRLAPGFADVADDGDRQMLWEPGLGRARVLSVDGRESAAGRWYTGASGPRAPIAVAAPAQCSTCGFFVPLAGELRRLFGVCSNEYAPDDARVVSVDHGCGAHSEAVVAPSAVEYSPPLTDEMGYEIIAPGLTAADEEALGHS